MKNQMTLNKFANRLSDAIEDLRMLSKAERQYVLESAAQNLSNSENFPDYADHVDQLNMYILSIINK